MPELFGTLAETLIAGDFDRTARLTQEALDSGAEAKEILNQGLLSGMDVVGRRFKAGEMFIPEVLRCAKSMHSAMEILRPLLSKSDAASTGTIVIGTVKGDLHDIGKNLVSMMFEGAGFNVIDLGIDKDPQAFVNAVREHKPDIVGMSALLTTTMPAMGETIEALKEAGLRGKTKVMVGGAPVSNAFAEEIAADGFATNAASAVEKGKELLSKS